MEQAYDTCLELFLKHGQPGDRDETEGMQDMQAAEPVAAAYADADADIEGQGTVEADELMRADYGSEDDATASSVNSSGGASDASAASWKQRMQWESVADEQRAASAGTPDDASDADTSSTDTPPAKAAKPAPQSTPEGEKRQRLRASIKRVAKVYSQRLLWGQTLADQAPNPKGYKLEKYRAQLTIMKDMLIRGWVDSSGQWRHFRNVEELQAYDARRRADPQGKGVPKDPLTPAEMDKPSFEELRKQMQGNSTRPRSCRTLWIQMKTLFPKLRKVRQLLKRKRDSKMVQVRSTHVHSAS